jgi:hypothetical protein
MESGLGGSGFFHDQVLEPGQIEDGINLGRWPDHAEGLLFVFHLPVILEQDSDSRGTNIVRLRQINENAIGSVPNRSENFDLKLIGQVSINASLDHEFPIFLGDVFLNGHKVNGGWTIL